jgi:hypothetical protein
MKMMSLFSGGYIRQRPPPNREWWVQAPHPPTFVAFGHSAAATFRRMAPNRRIETEQRKSGDYYRQHGGDHAR